MRCYICCEKEGKLIKLKCCYSQYHITCLDDWIGINISAICPHCRRELQTKTIWSLELATMYGCKNALRLLLAVPNPFCGNRDHLLMIASYSGYADIVRMLEQHPDFHPKLSDNECFLALLRAIQNGHLEVVQCLIKDVRVNPSQKDGYPLIWATINGHLEIVKLLLADSRVDPSAQGNRAITTASENGAHDILDLLTNHQI